MNPPTNPIAEDNPNQNQISAASNAQPLESNNLNDSEDLFVKPSAQAKLAAASTSNENQNNSALDPHILDEIEEKPPERTLSEFLMMMDQYTPIIPDAVTDFYLSKAGFECEDYRIKRLLALATQKFIGDIATDAFQYSKIRQQIDKNKKITKNKKTVLTMQDLSLSLREYGVNIKKPDYYL